MAKKIAGVDVEAVKVGKPDCLWNLIKRSGYPAKHWERYYKAPYNAKFRKLRPNPHQVRKGDVFHLPAMENPKKRKEMIDQIKKQIKDLEKIKTTVVKVNKDTQKKTTEGWKKVQDSHTLAEVIWIIGSSLVSGGAGLLKGLAVGLEKAIIQLATDLGFFAVGKALDVPHELTFVEEVTEFYLLWNSPTHWAKVITVMAKGNKGPIEAWNFDYAKHAKETNAKLEKAAKEQVRKLDRMIATRQATMKELSKN